MAKLQRRALTTADEVRTYPRGKVEVFDLGDMLVTRFTNEPGWRWSEAVKPRAGTDRCMFHHHGYTISGRLHVEMREGAEMEIGPGEVYEIPPGHDAWVAGDEPWVSIDWAPGRAYGLDSGVSARRTLTTLVFTDIVESTALARRIGDSAWQALLAEHNRIVRDQLARFGGREIDTTGDGFLALFDAAESAVRAGLAIVDAVRVLDLEVRVGVHTGEVELEGTNVRGLAVHVAARVLGLAGPSEVLLSWTTHALLSGSAIGCEHRGTHELKGLEGPRAVYRALPAT
jgi:class 3 adenylate cyclase